MIYYLMAVLAPALTSVAHILFKTFAIRPRSKGLRGLLDKRLMAGAVLFGTSSVMAIVAMRVIDFSAFFSFTALSYPFISILSRVVLREQVDRSKILGNAVIVLGILVYNLRF